MRTIKGRNGGTLKLAEKGDITNPKGRPRKLPDLKEILADVLSEEKDGKTAAQVIMMALRAKATKGDVRAAQILLERGYGKPLENEGQASEMVIHVKRSE